ncbi:hypothetical protein [Nocardioides sp.]|uniref:hypothetical protein n=1 Tax=Nocardioides sp. TaxID=35761 RepID=UPI002B64160A|nr:hypothetical protein [Nocardioides sp.]HXH77301.1 hypothetical protein [Nocardioides sp.]
MHDKEIAFIEAALFQQRITIRRTKAGHMVFRKNGETVGFLHADAGLTELESLLYRLARLGRIVWPPDW